MKTYELIGPRGHTTRQSHPSLEAAKKKLQPAYSVVGEVFGADSKGEGGIVDRLDDEPLIAKLMDGRNGAWLDEWVMKRAAVHARASAPAVHIAAGVPPYSASLATK